MSILIKGMEMPHDCLECYVAQFCKEYEDDEDEENKRPYGCPLVDVSTPHGRLIDADKLEIERRTYETYNDYSETFDMIDNAPTVIESEEE